MTPRERIPIHARASAFPCPMSASVDLDDDCVFINKSKDANGDYYSPSVNNVMSYYYGCSPVNFTKEQYEKMVSNYLTNPSNW